MRHKVAFRVIRMIIFISTCLSQTPEDSTISFSLILDHNLKRWTKKLLALTSDSATKYLIILSKAVALSGLQLFSFIS